MARNPLMSLLVLGSAILAGYVFVQGIRGYPVLPSLQGAAIALNSVVIALLIIKRSEKQPPTNS
jgi:hypothetical protein